jgi:hypothetical protein
MQLLTVGKARHAALLEGFLLRASLLKVTVE